MHWASAASMAPASSAARISSGVSTTLFSGVCWFVLFSSASVACTGGASGSCAASSGVSVCRVGIAVSCCAETVSVTAAVLSSGCAASASGAPIEKVIANARTAAAHRVLPRVPRAVSLFQNIFFMLCSKPHAFLSGCRPSQKGQRFIFSILFQYTPAGKPPSIAAHCKAQLRKAAAPVSENAPKQIRLSPQKHCTKPKIADISSKISILSCCLDMCMVLYLTCSFCIESTILKQKGSFSCQM